MNKQNTIRYVFILATIILLASLIIFSSGYKKKPPIVKFETNWGDFEVELYEEVVPITVNNFLSYVDEDAYDNVIFHRVIDDFMIQTGGYYADFTEVPTKKPISNEASSGLKNEKYTISMARTGEPHSATSQFFINVKNNPFLDFTGPTVQGYGYAVFGKVISGFETIDKIQTVQTGVVGPFKNMPTEEIIIEKAYRK